MTTTYTKISKPTLPTYTKVSGGKTLFNDQNTAFNATIPFDGVDLVYTKVV